MIPKLSGDKIGGQNIWVHYGVNINFAVELQTISAPISLLNAIRWTLHTDRKGILESLLLSPLPVLDCHCPDFCPGRKATDLNYANLTHCYPSQDDWSISTDP